MNLGVKVRTVWPFEQHPYQGLIAARPLVYSIAWFTSHTWFASIINTPPVGPAFFPFNSGLLGSRGCLSLGKCWGSSMTDRMSLPRRRSDSKSLPTFILKWLKPFATASFVRWRTFSSGNPSQPAEVM